MSLDNGAIQWDHIAVDSLEIFNLFLCPKSIKNLWGPERNGQYWQNTSEKHMLKKQTQKHKSVFCENYNSQVFQSEVTAVFFCWRDSSVFDIMWNIIRERWNNGAFPIFLSHTSFATHADYRLASMGITVHPGLGARYLFAMHSR